MLKNYIKTALRNLRRHKGYAFINIAGLAIGMACCLFCDEKLAAEFCLPNAHRIRHISAHRAFIPQYCPAHGQLSICMRCPFRTGSSYKI